MTKLNKSIKVSEETYRFLFWLKQITSSSSIDETVKKLCEAMQKEASNIYFWWDTYQHNKSLLESYPESKVHYGQEHCE